MLCNCYLKLSFMIFNKLIISIKKNKKIKKRASAKNNIHFHIQNVRFFFFFPITEYSFSARKRNLSDKEFPPTSFHLRKLVNIAIDC